MRPFALVILLRIVSTPSVTAAEPPELVPLADPQVFVTPPSFVRPNRWDVWQYYGVDRTGHWRPRVVLTPQSTYYLYNGAPYGLLPVKPRDYIPHIFD
ncbi:MAG TPA: hypothetical protein VL371_23855 [Gemmataceae bacterium]|jgi:hypothetical protein|nr:hypothetical protein [Gemmataceae bacterium]